MQTPILKFSAIFEPLSRKIHGRNICHNFFGDSQGSNLAVFFLYENGQVDFEISRFWRIFGPRLQNRYPPKCFAYVSV